MIQRNILLLLAAFVFTQVQSQNIPTVITNATIHIGNGQVITNGTIAFSNGIIDYVGTENKTFYKTATIINGQGKHVYPGLFALNNTVGLNEIDAVRATHDFNENGSMNPNVRAQIAYNTDSKIIPTLKFNGILFTQVTPQGGLISGSSSVMKTEAWNWEDATIAQDDGIHINWPEQMPWGNAEKQKEYLDKTTQQLKDFLAEAKQYCKSTPAVANVRYEAMRGIFNQSKKLFVHVNTAKGIIQSIHFFKQNYPEIVFALYDAYEAHYCIDMIKSNQIAVVVSNVHSLPSKAHKDIDQPYKTVAQLINAGITVAIARTGSWEARNVMFAAGTVAAYGVNAEQALQTITLNAAKIVGIDAQYGSVEKGKKACLIISEGDVLDMKSNNISHAFVNGEPLTIDNEQKALAKKFMGKYGLKD
jgi:hypothetical protein